MSPCESCSPTDCAGWPCIRLGKEGVVLTVNVVPGARHTELVGLHGEALRMRLAAPPVDGKANEALLAWLAESLGVPRRRVRLLRGQASRLKQVVVEIDASSVCAWLERALGPR